MMLTDAEARLIKALDRCHARGKRARFWLRDDDAVEPTPELDRYLAITGATGIPVTLAVIPEHTGEALQDRLSGEVELTVALHGWSHRNHAPATEKKQELGAHRPADLVVGELAEGFAKLLALYPAQFVAMLVPPWNRIAPALLPLLAPIGLRAVSVFGPEKSAPLPQINTHVDVMDWHDTRGGREEAVLLGEIVARLEQMEEGQSVGILTHHLVHDAAVDQFLKTLFRLTGNHPGCQWVGVHSLLDQA